MAKIQPIGEEELESVIPEDAIEESEAQKRNDTSMEAPRGKTVGRRSDPFREDRVAKNYEPVDSSNETKGG